MNKPIEEITWEDISNADGGEIFHDEFRYGIRFIILKGGSTLCAYVGVTSEHPLAGFQYDDIPIEAHGGLTFSGNDLESFPKGYYFYGWDYAHCGDYCDFYDKPLLGGKYDHSDDKKWLVKDVIEDSWDTLWQFKSLMKLSEAIATKYMWHKGEKSLI